MIIPTPTVKPLTIRLEQSSGSARNPLVGQPACSLRQARSNSFGQIATMDTLLWRSSRFGSEPEIAALIDVVEPFEAPVPGNAPNKAAIPFRTGATVMFHRGPAVPAAS